MRGQGLGSGLFRVPGSASIGARARVPRSREIQRQGSKKYRVLILDSSSGITSPKKKS